MRRSFAEFPTHGLLTQLEAWGYQTPPAVAEILAAANSVPGTDAAKTAANRALMIAVAAGDQQATQSAAKEYALATAIGNVNGTAAFDATRELALASAAAAIRDLIAEDAWRFLTERYRQAADRLTEAMAVCDPDVEPGLIMGLSKNVRDAWADFPSMAAELEGLSLVIRDAYEVLTSKRINRNRRDPRELLGLLVAPQVDIAALLQAWDTQTGRASRWGEMVKAGARLVAPASPADFAPLGTEVA